MYRFLVLLQRGTEHIANISLFTRLQHSVDDLLDRFVFFILDEWLERPGHGRLVLHVEFEGDLSPFNRIHVEEVSRDETSHFGALLTVQSFVILNAR